MSESRWKICGSVYGRLVAQSGLPGADVVSCGSRIRRLMWLVAIATLTYYTVAETTAIMREYFNYNVAVAIEYNTNDTLEFPDVTICNVNPFRKNLLCAALAINSRGMGPELKARLCDYGQTFKDANPLDLNFQQNLSAWAAVSEQHELQTIGHQFEDTVLDCSYADQDCDDPRYFLTEFDSRYGNCFCFHCNATGMRNFFVYGSLVSPQNGFVITLNAQLDQYLPTSYQAGFLVMIHAHGTRYSVTSDGIYAAPGHATYVGLNLLAQTGLPAPFVNPCRDDWPQELKAFLSPPSGTYTREECLNICLQSTIWKRCGCQSRLLPVLTEWRRYPVCDKQNGDACAMKVSNTETSRYLEERCSCLRPCLDITYRRDVTVTALRKDAAVTSDSKNGPPTRLVVYFNTFTYENIKSVPKYDGTRVLSNVGGINGMYMGLSFFVLFQVLDILVMGALELRDRLALKSRPTAAMEQSVQVMRFQ